MTNLTHDKVNRVILFTLVAATLALAVYVGVKGILAPPAGEDEAARKRAFDAAMRKGNLSLYDAAYWRELPEPAPARDEP